MIVTELILQLSYLIFGSRNTSGAIRKDHNTACLQITFRSSPPCQRTPLNFRLLSFSFLALLIVIFFFLSSVTFISLLYSILPITIQFTVAWMAPLREWYKRKKKSSGLNRRLPTLLYLVFRAQKPKLNDIPIMW